MSKADKYILIVFYILPTGILTLSTDPKAVGFILFSYTLGVIATYAQRDVSWFSGVF